MKKPKTLKDMERLIKMAGIGVDYVHTSDIVDTIKEWIKFLESEGSEGLTRYPQGFFQAAILKEIFNIEE